MSISIYGLLAVLIIFYVTRLGHWWYLCRSFKYCGSLLYKVHLSKLLIMCPSVLAKQLKHNYNQVRLTRGPWGPGFEAPRSGGPMNPIPRRLPIIILVCLISCVALSNKQWWNWNFEERSFSVDLRSVGWSVGVQLLK